MLSGKTKTQLYDASRSCDVVVEIRVSLVNYWQWMVFDLFENVVFLMTLNALELDIESDIDDVFSCVILVAADLDSLVECE